MNCKSCKLGLLSVILFFSTQIFSETTTTSRNEAPKAYTAKFQIIQETINLSPEVIKSATVISGNNIDDDYSIQIELTPIGAHTLNKSLSQSIEKRLNLVLNNEIITSPIIRSGLGTTFILTGFTRAQATYFEQLT